MPNKPEKTKNLQRINLLEIALAGIKSKQTKFKVEVQDALTRLSRTATDRASAEAMQAEFLRRVREPEKKLSDARAKIETRLAAMRERLDQKPAKSFGTKKSSKVKPFKRQKGVGFGISPNNKRRSTNTRAIKLADKLGLTPEEVIGRWNNGLYYCDRHGWITGQKCKSCRRDGANRRYKENKEK